MCKSPKTPSARFLPPDIVMYMVLRNLRYRGLFKKNQKKNKESPLFYSLLYRFYMAGRICLGITDTSLLWKRPPLLKTKFV
jgi:hypothetical protein